MDAVREVEIGVKRNKNWFEEYFDFAYHNTDLRTEILAGITTFMTMAYILFVNPAILSDAIGKDAIPSLVTATALSAGLATILMGLYAKKPFALAPGMGLNAYFTYGVVKGMGYSWQVALAAVFVEGLIFIALTLTKVRSAIIHAIPLSQKYAIGAGIGLFLTIIGMQEAGFVVDSPATLITFGAQNVAKPEFWLAIFGLFFAAILISRGIKGALLISILTTTVIGIVLGITPAPDRLFAMPTLSHTFLQMDLRGLLSVGAIGVVFAFFMVDFFDTLGTITGLSAKAGFLTKEGKVPDAEKVLLTDAIGTTVGAVLGTSTVTTYIESAAGIEEGGRTGMTALVTGALFLVIGLFISPIATVIPAYATAPALIIVGYYMLSAIRGVDFSDPTEAIPAFLVLVTIPFTYSIADGIGMGFISYAVVKTLSGRYKEVHPLLYILAGIFVLYFLYLGGVF
ncbi:NCS2 family permease [Thermococcus barophilus]|uniref:ABC transporter permease component n=2 Tax=Thermococcus barophilus TaxID=55802 RepID=A0A0S1XDH7_THEBA|nr:NCS2 family permease [Thermococcus barophilus]ADT84583.1 xanthine/uracil/thiamine/ascorbate permease [Thermococcus barophilus MP]ALM75867.1 ABC transporter permease component [Thermococcus barophilus]